MNSSSQYLKINNTGIQVRIAPSHLASTFLGTGLFPGGLVQIVSVPVLSDSCT